MINATKPATSAYIPMGYVDLHAHILPNVDDGSPDLPTSVKMLRGLANIGFSHVSATPHQKAAQFLPSRDQIDAAYREVKGTLPTGAPGLSLAAENFWDDVFFRRGNDGSLPRYDDGRAFLFEIHPAEVPARFEDSLFRLAARGWLPVLAHPERYGPLVADLNRVADLARSCALVVDLAALAGHHGFGPKRAARRLVAERLAHAAASDVHTEADVRHAAEGIAWIKKRLGPAAEARLLVDNPRRILGGEMPDA